ncbi:MAG: hypothetical protein AAF458_08125 [Pseudomonadota bacterium]
MTFADRLMKFPGTWIALALVLLLEAAVHWWFPPGLLTTGGFVVLGIVMLALWPAFYARSPANLAAIKAARQQLDAATVGRIQSLEEDLRRLDADQAVSQLRALREKLQTVTQVLERRLSAGELTYGRYLGTAEQVYLAAVDNLQQVAVSLTSVGGIDVAYIDKRLAELSATKAAEMSERDSLLERRALALQQQDKVSHLLAQNEAAMTALANTAAALADVRTEAGHASLDPETAMADLASLADRAKRLDVRS